MLSNLRLLALTMLAVLTLVLAACGGDDGDDSGDGARSQDSSNNEPGGDAVIDAGDDLDDDLFVSRGSEVLTRSADNFADDAVTSMTGDVVFEFGMGTTAVNGNADFAFEAPDKMHMALTFEGGDQTSVVDLSQFGTLEVLVRDGAFYMNIPFLGGWFVLTPDDLGEDAASIQDIMSRGSLFDYGAFVGELGDQVTFVGEESIDGQNTAHYQVQGDLQSLIASFSDALAATGDNAFADQIMNSQLNGPITVDLWVGTDDLLPYRMTTSASIPAGELGDMTLSLAANFGGYNQAVALPPAPADATSFAEIFGQLGLEPPAAPSE